VTYYILRVKTNPLNSSFPRLDTKIFPEVETLGDLVLQVIGGQITVDGITLTTLPMTHRMTVGNDYVVFVSSRPDGAINPLNFERLTMAVDPKDSVRIQDTRGWYGGLAILKCLPCPY
jgi:hypothetical protein